MHSRLLPGRRPSEPDHLFQPLPETAISLISALYGAVPPLVKGCYRLISYFGRVCPERAHRASSHHDTAERQYRYPTEFDTSEVPTSQWTVTEQLRWSSRTGDRPRVEAATVGRVTDYGITDANDMGSAMAPAFADTVWRHLSDMGRSPSDYDAIFSGDLGQVGSKVALHLLKKRGCDLEGVHQDTGLLIYQMEPEICAGASGCGCVASVFAAKIWRDLNEGALKRILLVPTGASTVRPTRQQAESLPCIAHAVSLVASAEEVRE